MTLQMEEKRRNGEREESNVDLEEQVWKGHRGLPDGRKRK